MTFPLLNGVLNELAGLSELLESGAYPGLRQLRCRLETIIGRTDVPQPAQLLHAFEYHLLCDPSAFHTSSTSSATPNHPHDYRYCPTCLDVLLHTSSPTSLTAPTYATLSPLSSNYITTGLSPHSTLEPAAQSAASSAVLDSPTSPASSPLTSPEPEPEPLPSVFSVATLSSDPTMRSPSGDSPAFRTRSRSDQAVDHTNEASVAVGHNRDGHQQNDNIKKRKRPFPVDDSTTAKKRKRSDLTPGAGGSVPPRPGGGNDRGCPPKAPTAHQLAARHEAERVARNAAADQRYAQEHLGAIQDGENSSVEESSATDEESTEDEHDDDTPSAKPRMTRQRRPWRGAGPTTHKERAHLISIRDSCEYSSQQTNVFMTKLCNVKRLAVSVADFYQALDALLQGGEALSSGVTVTAIYARLNRLNHTATAARFLMMLNSTLFVIKCQKRAAEMGTKRFQPTHIFKQLSTSADFPPELRENPGKFAEYYNYGETMAYLAAGFSYYGLMAMAMLGEAPALGSNINRCLAPEDVMRVARICRIPTGAMHLHCQLREIFIPAMKFLSRYPIQIPSLWDGMEPFYIDDLVSSDAFLDNAAYHAVYLSGRSECWDGFGHSTTVPQPLPPAPGEFKQELFVINKAQREGRRNPWEGQDKEQWANRQRAEAAAAPKPQSLLDLKLQMAERPNNSYVRINPEATAGSTLSFLTSDNKDDWVAHYITDIPEDVKNRFIKNMAAYFEYEAQDIDSSQDHRPSAIHCGIYARHRRDTHPLVREGAESKEHSNLATEIPSIAHEFLDHLMARLEHLIPTEYEKLWTYVDIMPFAANAGVGPFLSFVINIHFSTSPHYDPLDALNTCVAIQVTNCEGGDLILHEAGLVFKLGAGDVVVFRSASQTHFNLHYRGQRVSIILQSDKDLRAYERRVESGKAQVSKTPSFD